MTLVEDGRSVRIDGTSAAALAALALAPPTNRAYWLTTLLRVADRRGRWPLQAARPVEAAAGQQEGRRIVTHLEALGRLGCLPGRLCPAHGRPAASELELVVAYFTCCLSRYAGSVGSCPAARARYR